ncbi:hypothetical protein F0L74_28895 [Chitinophaga agrisoli]|uniref:Uncharacterized protein n=1 Tax=Chitinophaga agrisoli TaxID=2607653 RepID=A0A5B2VPP0_9BACT|nr:class I lanthipeptide [Chitinophaga agrisoli]KAA2240187.1 hypothetical protein F0L74_28895 [Chitinophaga agrisoli]
MKKKQQKPVKLALNKQTIVRLNAATAARLFGGMDEGVPTIVRWSAAEMTCNSGTTTGGGAISA